MSEKYKRIGWMIQCRTVDSRRWLDYNESCRVTARETIKSFEIDLSSSYQARKNVGLARCVPVYVEVQDAKP